MADVSFIATILPKVIPWLKFAMYAFIVLVITVVGVLIIIEKKKRKWKVEIHEQKADGRIHTVGFDVLEEKKLKMGSKTIYWLKKAKREAIPPPADCVDRYGRKEEVDYLRIERDYIPMRKTMVVNYADKAVRGRSAYFYDIIRDKIRDTKTTLFNADAVRDRFIYIPINKTLTANMIFTPIDYDVSMMAMNEIHNADEFYASKYEFWKKYGAIIVFAITIVFLIILTVLTFEYMKDAIGQVMGQVTSTNSLLQNVVDKIGGGGAKPPG